MKARILFIFLILTLFKGFAQVTETDTVNTAEMDSIALSLEMQEMVITNVKDTVSPEFKKKLLVLKRRVYKVYPYAKIAAERLTIFNANMAKLKTEKEKRKYSKLVEKYLEDEFEGKLKKMSRKDGQVLVKLIYRQTGHTTFDLIKEYKSGWKAFWGNRIAKLYDIDIKSKYNPATVPEDYYIEGYLVQAFEDHKLQKQDPAFAIDYYAIREKWLAKNEKAPE